jgi:DNA-binding IclR family transcriptional regulator
VAVTSSSSSVGGETSQTLDRGLTVLLLLGSREQPDGMTVTELAAALGVGRPIVYRLVATLEVREFVSRREDGRIRLGPGITRLAQCVPPDGTRPH